MKTSNQIKFILDDFDFNKVLRVMKVEGLKYNGSSLFPTKGELRKIAEHCLNQASDMKGRFSMGGFEAVYTNGALELNYIIEKSNPFLN